MHCIHMNSREFGHLKLALSSLTHINEQHSAEQIPVTSKLRPIDVAPGAPGSKTRRPSAVFIFMSRSCQEKEADSREAHVSSSIKVLILALSLCRYIFNGTLGRKLRTLLKSL